MEALEEFMKLDHPPKVVVRRNATIVMVYGFLDALVFEFTCSLLRKNNVFCFIGTWSKDDLENSSNLKEFANLVKYFMESGKKGWLTGNTILLATDSSTVEHVFYKGN